MKVLMVCLGNICRSPMAEGILRHKAHINGWNIQVDSAGTGGWHAGEAPDSRAMAYMERKGISIKKLRARQFTVNDFHEFDLILPMDTDNYRNVSALKPGGSKAEVRMVMELLYPGKNVAIPDPYYGGEDGFAKVYDMLDAALENIYENQ